MRLVLTEHDLVISAIVLGEVERVLKRKLRIPEKQGAQALDLLKNSRIASAAPLPADLAVRDPDDARILASAIAAGADVFVTGDRDLLDIRNSISQIVITDPRGFWSMQRS